MSDKKEYKAFVIMPFATAYDEIYRDLIKPSLEKAGYMVERADDISDQGNILHTIIISINSSDLIVADLTEPNPNVYYELGIAHALNKRVVMITQDIKALPFDLQSYKMTLYSRDFSEVTKLKSKLETIAIGAKNETIPFRNPVKDFLPPNMTSIPENTRHSSIENTEEDEEDIEKGYLDYLSDALEALEEIGEVTKNFTHGLGCVNEAQETATGKLSELKPRQKNYIKIVNEITNGFASDISDVSVYYEEQLEPYRSAWEKLQDSQDNLFSSLQIVDGNDLQGAKDYKEIISNFRNNIIKAKQSNVSYYNTLKSLKINIPFNKARNKLLKNLDSILETLELGINICDNTIILLSKMIADYKE